MGTYLIRLDDACEKRDMEKWDRMEVLLDQYGVKPLVGVIPDCKDPMMEGYPFDPHFWERVQSWTQKGWTMALHGYQHLYTTGKGGINPVNARSEFAGEPLEVQRKKIASGMEILRKHGVEPQVFFAPSHTFDWNTVKALKEETDIRIISDTLADGPYSKKGMTFVPQQAPAVCDLPYSLVTFCYHPNGMDEAGFEKLEAFLKENKQFAPFPTEPVDRKKDMRDRKISLRYFSRMRLKRLKNKLRRR